MKFSAKKVAKRFGVAAFLFFFIKGLIWLAVFFGLAKLIFPGKDHPVSEAFSVWVASAKDTSEQILQLKLVVPANLQDTAKVRAYGQEHLKENPAQKTLLSIEHCSSCEIEIDEAIEKAVDEKGYAVFKDDQQ